MIIKVVEVLGNNKEIKFFKNLERAKNAKWKYVKFCEFGILVSNKIPIYQVHENEDSIYISGNNSNSHYSLSLSVIKDFNTKRNYFYALECIDNENGFIYQDYFSNSENDCKNKYNSFNFKKTCDWDDLYYDVNKSYYTITKYKFSKGNDMRKECFNCPFMKE